MIIERSFLFLLLLIAVSTVMAQGQRTIDSLENKDTTLSKPQIFQLLLQSLRKNNKGENGSDESQDLKNFSEANELLGNYEEALKYRQMYDEVKDSLSEAERNSQLAELKVHQGNVERIFLILGIALLLILSGITYS